MGRGMCLRVPLCVVQHDAMWQALYLVQLAVVNVRMIA
jgi:hypothetical protein